jgi:hypothetical protein
MTFIETLSAILILAMFFAGFSQVFFPAYEAWHNAMFDLRTAKSIQFVSESFRNECAKQDRDIERWKNAVSTVKELESCEITELTQGGIVLALKAACIISGERLEIIGLCIP